MAYTFSNVSITCLCLTFTLYLYFGRSKIPKGLRLPPGPPRKPIVGNLTDVLSGDKPEYTAYTRLAKKYGDLVYLRVFGTSILLVNSYEMAYELLEKRGSIYSDRPVTPLWHDLTCLDRNLLVLMSYSDKVTRQRAIIHDLISAKKIPQYWSLLEEATKSFICDLNLDPDNLLSHIRHALGAFVMELSYGIKILPKNDPYIDLAEKTLKCVTKAATPGAYMVDVLPILKYLPSWFPGLEFPAAAAEMEELSQSMLKRPFEAAEELYKSGQARPSFVTSYFENLQVGEPSSVYDKETVEQVASMVYFGGIDTTDAALQSFFLAMAVYPEVQKKAQEELDRVVGKDSLPSFSNREHLPYIDAICKEILRWQPVGPFAMPHRLSQDDVIGEYFIPKDTLIFGNSRFLLRSTSKYGPDADKFRPERFLEKKLDADVAFGYGRRVCPGRYLAETSMFIIAACSLHMFDISAYDDQELRSIFENDLFDKGALARPSKPFRCKLRTRSGLERTMQQILIR